MQIYMWGIGGGAAKIIARYLPLDRIAGFVTSRKSDSASSDFMGKPIYTPEEMAGKEYDAIVVSSVYVENIYADCYNAGLDMNRVVFLRRALASGGGGGSTSVCCVSYLEKRTAKLYREAVMS